MMLLAVMLQAAEPATAVDAERAFAVSAQSDGQWTAFAQWAAPEAVLVGRRVATIDAIAALDDPPEALRWWPTHSFVSCDGHYAFNYGGWISPDGSEGGRFHTLWRKEDGAWRYLFDIGSNGTQPLPDTGAVELERPHCDTVPGSLEFMRNATNPGDIGASEDGSLKWSWDLFEDGARRLTVDLWDGATFRRAYEIHMPPPPPAPPPQ